MSRSADSHLTHVVVRRRLRAALVALSTAAFLLLVLGSFAPAFAQAAGTTTTSETSTGSEATTEPLPETVVPGVPDVEVNLDGGDPNVEGASRTVTLILLFTIGSVAPALMLLMTTFTRFIVVLGLTKQALALQTVPPSQVLVGLALFLTSFVMAPVLGEINEQAVQPVLAGDISQGEALSRGYEPLRDFMLAQVRDQDLALFIDLSGQDRPTDRTEVAATTLIPAFVVSELRAAFTIGFVIFVPFLLIDLIVAAVLMSMGMVMVPPVFISLPLKLLLFVLVDGWVLMIGSLVQTVNQVV